VPLNPQKRSVVVGAFRDECPHDVVEQALEVVSRVFDRILETLQSDVERFRPALDEPVGIQEQCRRIGHGDRGFEIARIVLGTPTGGSEPVHVYAPAVTKSGVVYAGQGPAGCGNGAQLVRYGGAGDPPAGTPLVSFPLGVDISWTFARRKADGSVDVLYARATCTSRLASASRYCGSRNTG